MTPYEKAVAAINARLEELQKSLGEADAESARQFLFQSIIVTLGLPDALNDYMTAVRDYAQRRHGEVKQTNEALEARHTELLRAGQALLEQLKTNPTDRAIRKEIELAQQNMAAIQNNLRRGANALQRDVAPSIAMIDPLAESVRRLIEAGDRDALKRVLKTLFGQVRDLYGAQPGLPAKAIMDTTSWEESVWTAIDQANGPADAYARAAYQAILALDLMTMAVRENPPLTAEEAINRAETAVIARLKSITARLTET